MKTCSICRDEAVEGRVLETRGDSGAVVRFGDGTVLEVATDLVSGVRIGDRLVVHLDVAIGNVREPADRPTGADGSKDHPRTRDRA